MNIFEITIQEEKNGSWPVETKLTRSYDLLPIHHKGELKLSKQDINQLTSLKIQRQKYGQFLGRVLFQGEISEAYLQALDSSWDGMRVLLTVEDKELETLYWHWLCAPREWNSISLNQRCCFSISLKSSTERVFPPINQKDLKALILAASPQDLEDYSLASFDVQETVNSLKTALGQIPTDVLAVDGGLGMPTLDEFCNSLTQTSYSLLHIVGHGLVNQQGETILYWATKENLVEPVTGSNLIQRLQNIQNLPHFIFLSACETAKSEAGMALGGLAQRIVRELGIPAVLAMTENVTIETAALLSKAFYPRLRKHGEVDKALVEATSSLSRYDILVPALFSRLGRNSLFDTNRNELSADKIRQQVLNKKSPYKGLKRFNFQDREYFFGRDALIYKLFTAVNQSSFSLVLGASGSGKSSVVRAGLIPELQEYIEIHKKFHYFIFTPNQDPFNSLYNCLINEEKDYKFSSSEANIALKAESETLMEILDTLKNEDEYWLLFIDQFEQLFTICTDLEKRKNFIEGIVEVAKKGENSVKIVLAMRSDFVEQFSFYPTLGAIANQNNIHLVTEMYPDELRRAITQPAAKNGVVFEEGLIEQIIEEVEKQKGYLPLLQYTLDLLWEKECKSMGADGRPHIEDRTLNKINYAALEGVRGALQKRVDEIYKNICEKNLEGELVTKQIFLKLVNIVETDSGSQPVGRRAYRNEFVSEPIESILKRFIDENLLVSSYEYLREENLLVGSRDDKYIEHATVEIAHEILLSSWEQLKRWLEAEKEAIILKNWLAGETRKWLKVRAKDELKASDELIKGSRLEQVVELRKKNGFEKLGGLVEQEDEFIDASVEWRDQQIREKEEQIQREQEALRRAKEAAEKLAEEQTQRAEEQTRFAEKLKKEKNQALITQSLFLVDLARQEISTGNATNAILLALEALPIVLGNSDARPYISEAEVKLYEAISNLREHIVLIGHQSPVTHAAFSSNGLNLVTTSGAGSFEDSKDNTARLWDINTGKQITIFEGHQDEINQAAFSPNGQYLVTASDDKTARLWEIKTGRQLFVFEGHTYYVTHAIFSPDGKFIVTSSGGNQPYGESISDGTVRLWDVNTGEQLTVFRGHEYGLSTDGKLLVTTSNDRKARLWNIKTGKQLTTFRGHEDVVEQAVFSPDGRFVATASKDQTARLWDIKTGKQLTVFRGHQSEIAQVSFSPDGQYLLTVARDFLGERKDQTARLWDANTGQQTAVFRGHEGRVIHADFSPDGQFVVTASEDRTARLWCINTGKQVAVLAGHEGRLYHSEFSPDRQCIVTTSDDNTVRLWKIDVPTRLAMFSGHENRLYHAEFSPDGKRILTAAGIGTYPEYDEYYSPSDKTARLWDANTGKELMVLTGHDALVNHAAFSPNGQYVVTASDDTTARLWDVKTGQQLTLLRGHKGGIVHAEFSPDSKYVATASRYDSVHLWNVEGGELAAILNGTDYVAFSPDGRKLVTTLSEIAYLWDANTGQQLTVLEGHKYLVYYAEFSPDGKYLVTASGGIRPTGFPAISDRSARLWDVETGQELAVLEDPEDLVTHAGFSPDGKHIVTTGVGSARLWDIETGQQVMVLAGHAGWVRHFVFSPNGKHLVTTSDDGTACLWNIHIGKQIAVLADHTSGVNHAAFSSDGQKLLLAYADGTAHLYRIFLSTQDLIDYARVIVPRELTSEQRKRFFLPDKSIL